MIRVVISLAKDDKIWLQHVAEDQHVSMAEVIRLAIERYRDEIQTTPACSLHQILLKTRGIWKKPMVLHISEKLDLNGTGSDESSSGFCASD